jgi:hypothetical protein
VSGGGVYIVYIFSPGRVRFAGVALGKRLIRSGVVRRTDYGRTDER